MTQFIFEGGLILIFGVMFAIFIACHSVMDKCDECGHDEEDHMENGCTGEDCDCREYK